MNEPTKKKTVLFRPAPTDGSINVTISVADALALRPQWDEAGAGEFLRVCGDRVGAKMLEAGMLELARTIQAAERIVAAEDQPDA